MKHDTPRTIYSRFHLMAEHFPDNTAIITGQTNVTFSELDRRIESIAEKIGYGRHGFIGIVMEHGIDMIAAMFAVLKTGAAYIPAEKFLPEQRIRYMMETAGAALVIKDEFCRGLQPATSVAADCSTPEGLAYVLYTSGTTGKPKGVKVRNSSVVNYAEAFEAEFHTAPGDIMLQYSVCSFDIFVEEVFATLLNGAALAIPSGEVMKRGIVGLMDFVGRNGVTEISGFPYLIAEINKYGHLPKSLRLLISGGDVMRASYIDRLVDSDVMIYNTYRYPRPSAQHISGATTHGRLPTAHFRWGRL